MNFYERAAGELWRIFNRRKQGDEYVLVKRSRGFMSFHVNGFKAFVNRTGIYAEPERMVKDYLFQKQQNKNHRRKRNG